MVGKVDSWAKSHQITNSGKKFRSSQCLDLLLLAPRSLALLEISPRVDSLLT